MRKTSLYARTAIRLFAASLSAAVLAGAAPAWAARDGGVSSKYQQQAEELLKKGDLKGAEIQLKNALSESPDNIDARFLLAVVYLRERSPAQAEATLNLLRQKNQDLERVMPLLGEVYLMENKPDQVLNNVQADGLTPAAQVKVLVLRARADLARQRADEAQAELDKAMAIEPDAPEVLIVAAQRQMLKRDLAGAEATVDRVLAKDGQNLQALIIKGDLRRQQGDLEGGLKSYDTALAAHPDDLLGHIGRATALIQMKRAEDADKDVQAILARDPKQPMGLYLRAAILAGQGKFQESLDTVQPAIVVLDGLPQVQLLLTEVYLRLNRVEQALDYAQRLYSEVPESPLVRTLLGIAYLAKNEPRRTVDLLEPVAPKNPDNTRLLSVLADAYSRVGRYDAAARTLESVAKANPADDAVRTRLDANRLGAGDREAAIKDLTTLVQTNPKAHNASVLLISVEMQNGHLAEAAKLADQLRSSEPGNPLADHLHGVALQIQGDRQGARKDFEAALAKRADFLPAAQALAQLNLLDGRTADARQVLENVVKTDPKNLTAMMSLAELARRANDFDGAMSWLDKAHAAQPASIEPGMGTVELLLSQKKLPMALTAANALAADFPNNPRALQAQAQAQLANGQRDQTMDTLKRMAALQPESAVEQLRLGGRLAAMGNADGALDAFRHAAKLDPHLFQAWRELAVGEVRAGRVDQAFDVASQAAAADAWIGQVVKAEVYAATSKYPEADAAYGAALAKRADGGVAVRRAEVRIVAGDHAGARKILSEWLAGHGEDDSVRLGYASMLLNDKDYASARKEFETLLKKAPLNPVVLNNLAWLYDQAKDPKALDLARRAYAIAPESPNVTDTLGWVLAGRGDDKEAAELLAQAHQKSPDDPMLSYHLATVLARQGEKDKAAGLLKPVLDSGQPFEERAHAEALERTLASGR